MAMEFVLRNPQHGFFIYLISWIYASWTMLLLKVCDADGTNTMKHNKFFERWNVNTRLQSIAYIQ
jgi:hypothetical protein